jgi:hypothetical protein
VIATLMLLCPVPQEVGERRAVAQERVPIEAEVEARIVDPEADLRLYELAHLTGYDELAAAIDAVTSADPSRPHDVLGELERVAYLREQAETTTESLLSAVRDMLDPPYVDGVTVLAPLEQGLVAVVANPAQHAWLDVFLQGAAAFDGLVDIQARIYLLARGELAGLDQARSGRVLSAAEAETLLAKLAQVDSEKVQAPRVVVHPFQEATLTVVDEVPYIKDYELKVIPDQQVEVADPVIDVARSGIAMRLRGVPLTSGELSIDAHLDYSVLSEPIQSVETTLGAGGHEVTIQLPEITKIRVEGRFRVFSGQTLMMASVDPEGDREVLVLVRAERVRTIRAGIDEER